MLCWFQLLRLSGGQQVREGREGWYFCKLLVWPWQCCPQCSSLWKLEGFILSSSFIERNAQLQQYSVSVISNPTSADICPLNGPKAYHVVSTFGSNVQNCWNNQMFKRCKTLQMHTEFRVSCVSRWDTMSGTPWYTLSVWEYLTNCMYTTERVFAQCWICINRVESAQTELSTICTLSSVAHSSTHCNNSQLPDPV